MLGKAPRLWLRAGGHPCQVMETHAVPDGRGAGCSVSLAAGATGRLNPKECPHFRQGGCVSPGFLMKFLFWNHLRFVEKLHTQLWVPLSSCTGFPQPAPRDEDFRLMLCPSPGPEATRSDRNMALEALQGAGAGKGSSPLRTSWPSPASAWSPADKARRGSQRREWGTVGGGVH